MEDHLETLDLSVTEIREIRAEAAEMTEADIDTMLLEILGPTKMKEITPWV